jgi:hypothetical protein
MPVIDVDPALLERSAAAALHAAEQGAIHMDGEIACLDEQGVPKLLETLTPTGPWAWAIMPEVVEGGRVRVPIATTLEEIAGCYRMTRGYSNMLSFEPVVEVRGAWYTFQEGVSRTYVPSLDRQGEHETIALFPVTSGPGITGELAWWRMDTNALGDGTPGDGGTASELTLRRRALAQHDRYVQALRDADVDAVLATSIAGVQSAVRDYVDDTGTLVSLDAEAGHRSHLERLFDRYEVRTVHLLERVVQPWYLFAELRFTLSPRRGPDAGRVVAFHTADFSIPGRDGRFVARIGHGTDPAFMG